MSESVKGTLCLNCRTPIPCICGKNQTDPSEEKLLLGRIEVVKAEPVPEPKLEPIAPPVEEITPDTSDEEMDQIIKEIAEIQPEEKRIEEAIFSVKDLVVGNPDPVMPTENVKVTVSVNDQPVQVPVQIVPSIVEAQVETTFGDKVVNKMFFRGKASNGTPVEMWMSEEALEKFVRSMLSSEEGKIQELLDKIHKIRASRGLFVEEIDKGLTALAKEADDNFDKCETKIDIAKVLNAYKAKLAVLTQKRYLAKFSIQEESELSLLLAKLRHSEM
jgi:hypothetical protein